jgi:hypothetical protein
LNGDAFLKLTRFLDKLEDQQIVYTIARHRDDTIMVLVAVPGERWEVEFFIDGAVEVERFTSSGEIQDENALNELFTKHSEQAPGLLEPLPGVELTMADG